jgi:hypothetical protein
MLLPGALFSPGIVGATGEDRLRLPASGKVPPAAPPIRCLSRRMHSESCPVAFVTTISGYVFQPKWLARFLG